jgi:hypothetical protein
MAKGNVGHGAKHGVHLTANGALVVPWINRFVSVAFRGFQEPCACNERCGYWIAVFHVKSFDQHRRNEVGREMNQVAKRTTKS